MIIEGKVPDEVVKEALESGLDPFFQPNEEVIFSRFHQWCRDNMVDYVRAFLPYLKKGDINIQSRLNMTPLMLAVYNGNIEITSMLLTAGADPTLKNDEGMTAAELALRPMDGLTVGGGRRACRRLLAGAAAVKALEAELG
jgi:ankyrin repeat protein